MRMGPVKQESKGRALARTEQIDRKECVQDPFEEKLIRMCCERIAEGSSKTSRFLIWLTL